MAESILDRIVASVTARLDATPPRPGLGEAAREKAALRRASSGKDGPRSLLEALGGRATTGRPAIIAECKKASPSAGVLRSGLDPAALSREYSQGGAAAISVVTEPDHFQGDPAWLHLVRDQIDLPVLRKDFIVCERQLEEAILLGADAVLLIQRILEPDQLAHLLAVANELDLDVLLEVFADEDPEPAVASGAAIIGVNARDLSTFEMRLERVAELASRIPDDRVRVAESGIDGPEVLARLHQAGYGAFLIGEHLVRSADPGAAIDRLLGGRQP